MNREIKFRGKRIDTGKWEYGYYAMSIEYGDNGGVEHYYRETQTELHYILDNDGGAEIVYPETVGQYTGRTAQCTDEIYEGDICEVTRFDHNGVDTQYKCVVEYIDGSFAFVFEKNEYKHVFWFNDVYDTDSDVEVIGNIHDKEGESVG